MGARPSGISTDWDSHPANDKVCSRCYQHRVGRGADDPRAEPPVRSRFQAHAARPDQGDGIGLRPARDPDQRGLAIRDSAEAIADGVCDQFEDRMVRELLGIATGAESEAGNLLQSAMRSTGPASPRSRCWSYPPPAVLVQDQLDIPLGMARERADSLITLMHSPGFTCRSSHRGPTNLRSRATVS